jgi:hypothetical protein
MMMPFYLTPMVLVYLQVMDLIYIINTVTLMPLAIILKNLGCIRGSGNIFEEKLDYIYEVMFGMSKMDIKGFRRLRTVSQLSFESIP